jgi:hypothetical protein
MDHRKTRVDMDWNHEVQDLDKWRALVDTGSFHKMLRIT